MVHGRETASSVPAKRNTDGSVSTYYARSLAARAEQPHQSASVLTKAADVEGLFRLISHANGRPAVEYSPTRAAARHRGPFAVSCARKEHTDSR